MKTTLKKLHNFFGIIITISTNQLYSKLQDCIPNCSAPTIPIRKDTNRGTQLLKKIGLLKSYEVEAANKK